MTHYITLTLALAASLMFSMNSAVAASATGRAAVTIVAPLAISEVVDSAFTYSNITEAHTDNNAEALVVKHSPRSPSIIAANNTESVKWGEFTLTGKNMAQLQVSSRQALPQQIQLSNEKAMVGNQHVSVNSNRATSIDLSKPQKLALYSAVNVSDTAISGQYQPTYTIALHYE